MLVGGLALLLTGGCAGVSPAHVSQTVGTIVGSAIVPGIGAPLGALVGMLAGVVMQGHVDKVTAVRERQELNDQLAQAPSQQVSQQAVPLQGEPTRVWVDETVSEGRVLAGHFGVRYIP